MRRQICGFPTDKKETIGVKLITYEHQRQAWSIDVFLNHFILKSLSRTAGVGRIFSDRDELMPPFQGSCLPTTPRISAGRVFLWNQGVEDTPPAPRRIRAKNSSPTPQSGWRTNLITGTFKNNLSILTFKKCSLWRDKSYMFHV